MRKRNILLGFTCFVMGAGAGYLAAYKKAEMKWSEIANDEINSVYDTRERFAQEQKELVDLEEKRKHESKLREKKAIAEIKEKESRTVVHEIYNSETKGFDYTKPPLEEVIAQKEKEWAQFGKGFESVTTMLEHEDRVDTYADIDDAPVEDDIPTDVEELLDAVEEGNFNIFESRDELADQSLLKKEGDDMNDLELGMWEEDPIDEEEEESMRIQSEYAEQRKDEQYQKEMATEPPRIISEEELSTLHLPYEMLEVSYYPANNLLVDDMDEFIPDTNGVVGNDNLMIMDHEELDRIFVLNHQIGAIVEVLRYTKTFYE